MDYEKYLPHIDVNDGKARVMNNLGLYTTLLKKFKGRQMTEDLIAAIGANDLPKVGQVAHALRGTAANLSFPTAHKVVSEIEKLAKGGENCAHLTDELQIVMTDLESAIAELTSA